MLFGGVPYGVAAIFDSYSHGKCSDYCCGCCCFMLMAAEQGTVRPRGKEASWL